MQAQGNQPVRYGVLAVIGALVAGLLWLGMVRWQAEKRSASLAEPQAAAVPASAAPAPEKARAKASPVAQTGQPVQDLIVHVTGAVASPGVYRLQQGLRVSDAIAAAGGALPEGKPDVLNLAARLSDSDKVYVPTVREAQDSATASPAARGATKKPTGATASKVGTAPAQPVNVNTASVAELDRVNGIGPATAKAIVAYRTDHGPFGRIDDLEKVAGIGPKTLERLRPYLTL